jgi:hypothetical protein
MQHLVLCLTYSLCCAWLSSYDMEQGIIVTKHKPLTGRKFEVHNFNIIIFFISSLLNAI